MDPKIFFEFVFGVKNNDHIFARAACHCALMGQVSHMGLLGPMGGDEDKKASWSFRGRCDGWVLKSTGKGRPEPVARGEEAR